MDSNRVVTEFGPQSTASDVLAGVDLRGKRALVTGGASGIGVETARAPAGAGAEVTLAVRNLEEAGGQIAEDLNAAGVMATAADGIAANAPNPGRISMTGLRRHIGDLSAAPDRLWQVSTDLTAG